MADTQDPQNASKIPEFSPGAGGNGSFIENGSGNSRSEPPTTSPPLTNTTLNPLQTDEKALYEARKKIAVAPLTPVFSMDELAGSPRGEDPVSLGKSEILSAAIPGKK